MSFADLATAAYRARISLSATGYYRTPEDRMEQDHHAGAAVLLFRVWGGRQRGCGRHADRGNRSCCAVDILQDVGSSLNTAIDLGQIEGGFCRVSAG